MATLGDGGNGDDGGEEDEGGGWEEEDVEEDELSLEAQRYVLLPYTAEHGVQHEFALTLYTDHDVEFEKIDPTKVLPPCFQCTDPAAFKRVTAAWEAVQKHKSES